jgi:hypothetical protein
MTNTPFPVTAAGTHDDATWGEGSAPFSIPPQLVAGMIDTDPLPADTLNYVWQICAAWTRALRDRMCWSDAGLYGTFVLPSSASGYASWLVAGLSGNIDPVWVMIDAGDDGGVVVPFYVSLGSAHLFTASRDTYVNLNEDGLVEYQEVPNSDPPPTPTALYVAVWKVVTDATDITSSTVLIPTIPVFKAIGVTDLHVIENVLIEADLEVGGDTQIDGALTVDGQTTLNGSSLIGDSAGDTCTVNATFTVNNNSTIGSSGADTCQVNAVTTFIAAVSFNGDVTLGNAGGDAITCTGALTVNGTVVINNGCTLGSSAADALTINSTTAIAAPVTIAGNTITGTAGSIIDVERVDVTEIRFDSDTTPSTTTGVMQFTGRWLAVGLNSLARKVSIPVDDWVASFSTVNTIADTGAEVTMVLGTGDVVIVETSLEAANTSAANDVNLRIEVNGGIIGTSENYRPVANDKYFAVRRVVEYTAPADNAYVFKTRAGASSGTTSVQNVHLSVRHSN